MNTPKLPTLPFAVFDEFGQPCEDRVRDHFASSFEALRAQIGQGVPDGDVLQIDAAVTQAQKVLSDWNEWYGTHGKTAQLPPGGIVKAQELLAVAKSLLASAPLAPQVAVVQQEPVGVVGAMPGASGFTMACFHADKVPVGSKLYLHPAPQQKPLLFSEIWDNDAIMEVNADARLPFEMIERFVRAIEAAHNIGEKK